MTKREENKLTMYKAVSGMLKNNKAKTETVPAFKTVEEQFTQAVENIEIKHGKHQSVAKGAAQQKGVDEDELVDGIVTLGSLLYVLAVQKGDRTLQEAAKVTESQLKQMRDAELLSRARTVFEKAEANKSELTNYGIDEAKLSAIKTQIDKYAGALEGTEAVAAEKTATRQSLSRAFDQADHVLYNMIDPLMEIFRSSDSDIYNQYFSARVIKDL
jgi:predicted peroxiredoxin